jgi:hypothetical protein
MNTQEIVKLMAPPAHPVAVPTQETWQELASVGYAIPENYRQFLSFFGIGAIDNWLWLMGPGTDNKNLDLVVQTERQKDTFKQAVELGYLKGINEESLMDKSLIVFGVSDNGDVCFYCVDSAYVIAPRMQSAERFKGSIVDFIGSVISRGISVKSFPDDFPEDKPSYFTPPFQPFFGLIFSSVPCTLERTVMASIIRRMASWSSFGKWLRAWTRSIRRGPKFMATHNILDIATGLRR